MQGCRHTCLAPVNDKVPVQPLQDVRCCSWCEGALACKGCFEFIKMGCMSTPTLKRPPAPLQRVYGVTFPDKDQLKDYQMRMEEAKRRDHRNVGTQMELFFFHRLSPGSCFFLPNGARVYNTLVEVRDAPHAPWLTCTL